MDITIDQLFQIIGEEHTKATLLERQVIKLEQLLKQKEKVEEKEEK